MKKLITILTLLLSINAGATIYYVATSGNDANNGTSTSTPFKTISKINSITKVAGDQILFNRGDIFYGSIVVNNSGSLGNSIIYGAYGSGANPVITGFTTVTGWTSIGTNLWESSALTANSPVNLVTINGINTAMGRTPDAGTYYVYSASTTSSLTSSSLDATVTNWTGAELVSRRTHYILNRYAITGASTNTLSYTSSGNQTSYAGTANYGFFIQNDSRTLTTQNEWYYNPTTKKLDIYSTSSPTNVQASTIDTLVKSQGVSYITFDHINFTGSNMDAFVINTDHLTIQYCTIDYSGKDAIWGASNAATSTTLIVQNCTINHTNNNFINLESLHTGALIQYNTIKNCGMLEGMGASGTTNYANYNAIQTRGANTTIQNNVIDSIGYNGISFYANNALVQNNYVHYFNNVIDDGAGIYTWIGSGNTAATGQRVLNNIVLDGQGHNAGTTDAITALPSSFGIYLDDYVSGVEVSGNTCARNSYSGLYLHNAMQDSIHDNLFYDNDSIQCFIVSGASVVRNIYLKHNKFISAAAKQYVYNIQVHTAELDSLGRIDSNYITRPIDDNLTIFTYDLTALTSASRTLAGWLTYTSNTYDTHSSKSVKTITTTSDIALSYNATASSVNAAINWYGITVDGLNYNGLVSLAPYSGAVTMNNGTIISGNGSIKLYGNIKCK